VNRQNGGFTGYDISNLTSARFECPEGNSTFSIHRTAELPKGAGIYIYIECKKLDEYVNRLIERGIPFDEMSNDKI
jgi:hypothetical protein